jgi:hypothetical protein
VWINARIGASRPTLPGFGDRPTTGVQMPNRHANAFPHMRPIGLRTEEPAPQPSLSHHVERVLGMIAGEANQLDKELLATLVTRAAAQYEDAPVQDYVPVLVFKEVRDHLRQLRS